MSELPPALWPGFAFLLGLNIGSFLNVVVHRLPRGESLVSPGSHCPACGEAIAFHDNVPVLAYLWLRGRCRHCRVRISPRYPAVELSLGLLFAAIAWRHEPSALALVWLGFAAALVAAALIDFEHQIIPDSISVGGLVAGLALVPAAAALGGAVYAEALAASALGATLGGGLLWIVGFGHARLSAALGRRFAHWPEEGEGYPAFASLDYWTWFPGLGFGDVKLLAMIGAFLGPFGVVETLLFSAVAGLALGLAWIAVTREPGAPFGFGPAITAGALLVLLFPGLTEGLFRAPLQ